MIAVALKGLAGRKVRALLTALAVVIGISMVSGTYILTDTMQKSFDGLFSRHLRQDRRRHQRQGDRQGLDQRTASRSPRRCWPRSQALPEVEAAGGSVAPDEANAADIIGARRQARRPRERRRQLRPRPRRVQPAQAQVGRLGPGPGRRSSSTPAPPPSSTTSSATRSRSPRSAPSAPTSSPASSPTARSTRSASRSIAAWDLKTAQTLLHREGGFDSISIAAAKGTSAAELVRAVAAARARHAAGQGQRQAGEGRRRRAQQARCRS